MDAIGYIWEYEYQNTYMHTIINYEKRGYEFGGEWEGAYGWFGRRKGKEEILWLIYSFKIKQTEPPCPNKKTFKIRGNV